MSICWRCSHVLSSSYIVHVELWNQNLQTGFQISAAPESPSVIAMIWFLSISGAPDATIAKEFAIFTESIMLNNLQSIAQENSYQHLDSPETDTGQLISHHLRIERLSKRYRVDVSYPKTWLAHSRLTRRIQCSIPHSRMKFRHTSDPLSCRVLWSQIWHHTHILFKGYFRHAGTHYSYMIPLQARLWTVYTHSALPLNQWLPAHRVSSVIHWTLRCRCGSSRSAPA